MTELLTELLEAGLIEKLSGDDTRLEKIERAAGTVAQGLREQPPRLIRAVLAGLDPDVPADDPAIMHAKQALVAEWKSMISVYTDTPVGLLRAILLEASNQVGEEGDKAAILWLTAADMLPLRRLGREEQAVHKMLEACASRMEGMTTTMSTLPDTSRQEVPANLTVTPKATATKARRVDRASLRLRVGAAAGPNLQSQPLVNANPHWSGQNQHWSWEFTERMSVLLAEELDTLGDAVQQQQQTQLAEQLTAPMSKLVEWLKAELRSQDLLMRDAVKVSEHRIQAEKLRLDALWWSEAMYSSSLRLGYRDIEAPLAAVIMAVDLLAYIPSSSPASVGYLLAETVNRLPNAGFERRLGVRDLLVELHRLRGRMPKEWMSALDSPPAEGRLSLRDVVVLSLQNREWDVDISMQKAGLHSDTALSLPALAHAIFRQEQAVRLAGSDK